MLNDAEIKRYDRHLILPGFGLQGQEKLKSARVLVIGAGGLGCPVLLYLTAAGVGEIGIVDDDHVDESNLQRQVLYSVDDIGKLKSEVAAEKLKIQNPHIVINPIIARLTNKNALDIMQSYDFIVDGTDNFTTRYLVNDACVLLNKTLIYGSIYKFEGQVAVFNHKLKDNKYSATYRCLFPKPPESNSVPNCSEIGVLGVLPGIVGCLQATEVIKLITGVGENLVNKLLFFDALSMTTTVMSIERNNLWESIAPKTADDFVKVDYVELCESKNKSEVKSISSEEVISHLSDKKNYQFLDVREISELPIVEELIDLQIPLSQLERNIDRLSKDKKILVFCKSGARSKLAIQELERKYGLTNLYNLDGGVMAFLKIINK